MSFLSERLRRGIAVLLVGAALFGAACGEDAATKAAEAREIKPLDAVRIPGKLNGLSVKREEIQDTVTDGARRPYLDAIALFSLRQKDKLQATLQIGRFSSDAKYNDDEFRATLLNTIGGGVAKKLRMGDHDVFFTTGDRQSLAVWFEDRFIYILSSRDDYDYARGLLRQALEVSP